MKKIPIEKWPASNEEKVRATERVLSTAIYLTEPDVSELAEAVGNILEEKYGEHCFDRFIEVLKDTLDNYRDPTLYCLPCQAVDKNGCHCPLPYEIND